MNLASFIVGYHGCDEETAEKLINGVPWVESCNGYDWLGDGIYFWENDCERALDWALQAMKNPAMSKTAIKSPSVVAAIVAPRSPLDLTVSSSRTIVKNAYHRVKSFCESSNVEMPKNEPFGKGDIYYKKRMLDCTVMNSVDALEQLSGAEPIDLIRAPFMEGDPLYDGGAFTDKMHIQLCVKNPAIIKGVFIPEQLIARWHRKYAKRK